MTIVIAATVRAAVLAALVIVSVFAYIHAAEAFAQRRLIDQPLPQATWQRLQSTLEAYGYTEERLAHYYVVDLVTVVVVRDTTRCDGVVCTALIIGKDRTVEVEIPRMFFLSDRIIQRGEDAYSSLWFQDIDGEVWLNLLVGWQGFIVKK